MKRRVTRSIVPNMLTLGNLFSGFTAMVHISNGQYKTAALFIFIAAVFDMLDGVMARLIHSTSELGAELDSLCDAVSFGVAPSFLLYHTFFYQYGDIGLLFASFPALAGVVRLARFNVQLSSFEDKVYFKGMPIPSAALTLIAYVIFYHLPGELPKDYAVYMMFFLSVAVSLAMVSTVKYDNMPRPTLRSIKQRPIVFVFFLGGIIASLVSVGKLIFPVMLIYLLSGAVRFVIQMLKEKREAVDEIDDTDDIVS